MCTTCRYVFYEAPLKVNFRNFAKYLLGTSDQTKMVAFDRERPGRWMLVPRGGGDKDVVYIDTPPQFIFHYAAAVETAEGGPISPASGSTTLGNLTLARCLPCSAPFVRLITVKMVRVCPPCHGHNGVTDTAQAMWSWTPASSMPLRRGTSSCGTPPPSTSPPCEGVHRPAESAERSLRCSLVLESSLICVVLHRSVLSPSRRVATSEELFPRSADLPIVNEIAAGRGDYRCARKPMVS